MDNNTTGLLIGIGLWALFGGVSGLLLWALMKTLRDTRDK